MESLKRYQKRSGSAVNSNKLAASSKASSSSTLDTDQVSSRSYKTGANSRSDSYSVNGQKGMKRANSATIKPVI